MISTLSRRLRVRDDGTGRGREEYGTLAEFESEDTIILLGDPGMGKTTLFKDTAKANYTTVRNFLIKPEAASDGPLYLDALDEYRTIARGQDASFEVAKALCSLKKPKFRLSCRAADWFGSTDEEVLRVASASGRVVVLELCPLSHDEILIAVQGLVENPAVFLEEAESAGLGDLLGNPQTLELLARAWGTNKKPQNKFEAYEIGVSEMIKEMNLDHVERGDTSSDLDDLRKATSAVASTMLLSNSVGISRTEPAEGDGHVKLSVVPYPNRSDLEAVLKRRLFVSTGQDRFALIHRTIAEFLAAQDLSERIKNGLPIDRVMALICGNDGRPVSSLRGLFAWLMCNLGHIAEDYVERDPYGLVTYGDASVLPPNAQRAVWIGLSQLRDPWFLTKEEDRGSFRELANLNTKIVLKGILEDPATGVHLKIAVLEAIANSTQDIGLTAIIQDMVLDKCNNTWLRSTALKAFAKLVQNDETTLESLDSTLSNASDDVAAYEVRASLLSLTGAFGGLPLRLLSILEQCVTTKNEEHVIGRLYQVTDLPSDSELDVILDGADRVLAPKNEHRYEFRSLFNQWLKRRLEIATPITPLQLSNWLQNIHIKQEHNSQETLTSLKVLFANEPKLFERVFELLANNLPNIEHSFWHFVAHDLWRQLPLMVWPVPQSEFFLARAEEESDPERAADLFRMYITWFPEKGGSVAYAEAGFDLLEKRPAVAEILGKWESHEIAEWQKNQWERKKDVSRKQSVQRAENVAYITPRLTTVREGTEEHILSWAAMIYQGHPYDTDRIPDAHERLVNKTNEEIADAIVQGFMQYAENPTIPKKDKIIERWLQNSIPNAHILLGLSVFLRRSTGMNVPDEALPNCLTAVVTLLYAGDKIPGYEDTLLAWLLHEVQQHPNVVKSVLKELWVVGAENKDGDLPCFYKISQNSDFQPFLASLSADILKAGINEHYDTVRRLVSLLIFHDQHSVIEIGENELAQGELSAELRVIWSTALFAINPSKYLDSWRTLIEVEESALWNAIEVIKGDRYGTKGVVSLTTAQRAEIIMVLGQRFPNVGHPSTGGRVSQEPWEATDFIANQISLLAADSSSDAGVQLARLEKEDGLASYHNLIRHHMAQHEKQQRESSFTFVTPEQVAEAILNRAPATPMDFLVYIVDHLGVLSREIASTQRERYRAYWNESGRDLVKPKYEEVCSGLLAEDLQNRVKDHGLIVTVEHHMVDDKECDLVVLQGTERLLPIEAKHHYNPDLWTAWSTQLDRLYTRDVKTDGLGIYLIYWSGEAKDRKMPKLPDGLERPNNAAELKSALESLIPDGDRHRLRIVVVDISRPDD